MHDADSETCHKKVTSRALAKSWNLSAVSGCPAAKEGANDVS